MAVHNKTNYVHLIELFIRDLESQFPDGVPATFRIHLSKAIIDETYSNGYHEDTGEPCPPDCQDRTENLVGDWITSVFPKKDR